MNSEKLLKVIDLFIDKREDSLYKKPFLFNGKICATDKMSMVITPEMSEEYEDMTEKISKMYPPKPINELLRLDDLKIAYSNVLLLDCYDEVDKECSECGGDGNVDFEYHYDNSIFYTEGECPACEGEGHALEEADEPNGKKRPDCTKFICIKESVFQAQQVSKLIALSDILGVSEIFLNHQPKATAISLFTIGECEVTIAPVRMDLNDPCIVAKL